LEFLFIIGNAGTGMYQRGTFEHGCEYVPVAGKKKNDTGILSTPYRRKAYLL